MAFIKGNLLGEKALRQKLDRLPNKIRNKAVRPALNRQSTVVRKAARKLCPVGDEDPPLRNDGSTRPHLRKVIISRSRTYSNNITNVIGVQYGEGAHRHLVHDGTKPHPVSIRSKIEHNVITGWYQHPGATANPFLRKALEQTKAEGLSVFASALKANIEKVAVSA